MLIARQRLDLLKEGLRIPGKQLQTNEHFIRVDNWFEAKEISESEYLLKDVKGVAVGIFDSIDLDFEVLERANS